jgi:serine/threonine protein kinase/tetratricopeptide (TPR) repeat protein
MQCPKCLHENPENSTVCFKCETPIHPASRQPTSDEKNIKENMDTITEGTIINNKFEITKELGGGGMGVVYEARDIKLNRTVALKFIPLELTRDQQYKERFIKEAQAASSLDHQNICTIYEISETDDGKLFIAMPRYDGETVKEKLKEGPLPIGEAIDIGKQVARGLAETHNRGIIHRDIKPANIIVTSDGIAKILDFGLSKQIDDKEITRTAAVMGTMAFMSPEQISGEEVGNRADIWSLGVVMYEMLTGRLPFEGDQGVVVIHSIINKSPIPPTELRAEIPMELERIVLKCLRKDPNDRYSTTKLLFSHLVKLEEELERKKLEVSSVREAKAEERKEAERRQATVVVLDLAGHFEMLEGLDSEEAASIMTRCSEILRFIEEKYEGTIQKIADKSFMAFFGAPIAIEDAPKKAVNAAIEMRNKFQIFSQEENLRFPLEPHIGISTGTVIVGAMYTEEKKEPIITGDTVNRASQIKDSTRKGEIYVDQSVYRYTKEDFEYKPLKPLQIKGKKETISVLRLLSKKEKLYRVGIASDRMIHSEMVGRTSELNKLKLHVLKVINGEGSIVNIIGEAGIGKSRLIAELLEKEEIRKVQLLMGRALSFGKNLSFHPVIDLMKKWVEIKETDSSAESYQKLEKAITKVDPEGSSEIFPFVATLMGIRLTGKHASRMEGIKGEALEKLILKSLRELFGKLSTHRPIVVIIEDLHWADLSSIGILESLYRLAENNRILFINVCRPGFEETGERILGTIKSRYGDFSSDVILESLDENQSGILINNLLKIEGLSPNILELITGRAGGNPFFIEEVVRSFIDEGVVKIEAGHFRITQKIDTIVIPETINEVLMSRIDRLDEKTRTLLKIASVIGRNFFYKILTDVARTIDGVDDRLDLLKDTQLILERYRMEELEYLFKHALAQEATYESILFKTRKQLHLKIATSIESVFSDRLHEFYGMLALHYSKGEDLDKAEEYLIKAGEDALKSSASSEALNYYREALDLYLKKYGDAADPEKIAMLEKNIALALFNRGQYVEADEYFSRVLSHYGEKLPKQPIALAAKSALGFLRVLIYLYFPFLQSKKIPSQKDSEIFNLFYKKSTALTLIDPRRMFIEMLCWLWRLFNLDLTKIKKGVEMLSSSSAAFSYGAISFRVSRKVLEFIKDKIDEKDAKSLLYYKLPEVLLNSFSGNWDSIGDYDDALVNQNVRSGEFFYTTGYVLTHGWSKIPQGKFEICQKLAQKLHEIADVYENDNATSAYYFFNTRFLVEFRKLREALRVLEEGIEITRRTGYKPHMFSLYSFKARIQMMMGDLKSAENILHYLDKIRHDINLAPTLYGTFLMSQLIFDLLRLEESIKKDSRSERAYFRKKALKTAKKTIKNSHKIASDIVEAYKLMGIYYWLLGRQKRSLKWWEKSIEEGERLGAMIELSRTYMEVGKKLLEKKSRFKDLNGITSHQFLAKAKIIFEELDLQWDLRELLNVMEFSEI